MTSALYLSAALLLLMAAVWIGCHWDAPLIAVPFAMAGALLLAKSLGDA